MTLYLEDVLTVLPEGKLRRELSAVGESDGGGEALHRFAVGGKTGDLPRGDVQLLVLLLLLLLLLLLRLVGLCRWVRERRV